MRRTWGPPPAGGSWLPFRLRNVPVVRGLLVALAAVFVAYLLKLDLSGLLVFHSGPGPFLWADRFWTWFTYPFVYPGPFALLLQGFWLYVVGGSLERSWGSRNFALLFFAFTAIAALAWVPVYAIFAVPVSLGGLVLPLSALTVAWAALDPEQEIYFYGVFPLKLKLLALIDVILVYASYVAAVYQSPYAPLIALFSLAGPAAAWIYVRKLPRLNVGFRAQRSVHPRREPLLREDPRDRERVTGFNPLRRLQEQQEIERLRRLLGEDDDNRPASWR